MYCTMYYHFFARFSSKKEAKKKKKKKKNPEKKKKKNCTTIAKCQHPTPQTLLQTTIRGSIKTNEIGNYTFKLLVGNQR